MAKEIIGRVLGRWFGVSSETQLSRSSEDAGKMLQMVALNIIFAGPMVLATLLSRVEVIIKGPTSNGLTDSASSFCCFLYSAVVALFCALIINSMHVDYEDEHRATFYWVGWLGSGLGFIGGLSFALIYMSGLFFR